MPATHFRTDARGLASGIIGFVLILVVTAILYSLLDPVVTESASYASVNADTSIATETVDVRLAIWERLPFFGLGLALLFVLARAVFESRGGQQ